MNAFPAGPVGILALFLLAGTAGCGGGNWSADDPVPGWMGDLESAIPSRTIDASSISGSGYNPSTGTFTIGNGTFTVTVEGLMPRGLPLRLLSGASVDVTYTSSDGSKFQLTLKDDNPSIRLPLRPGTGTLHLLGRSSSPSGICTVRLSS